MSKFEYETKIQKIMVEDGTKVVNILCTASKIISEGPLPWEEYIKFVLKKIESFTEYQWSMFIDQLKEVKKEDVIFSERDIDEYFDISLQDTIRALRQYIIINTLTIEDIPITE